jgi:hypothetical protein
MAVGSALPTPLHMLGVVLKRRRGKQEFLMKKRFLFLAIAVSASQVNAQFVPDFQPTMSWSDTALLNVGAMTNQYYGTSKGAPDEEANMKPVRPATLIYSSSTSRTRANLARFVEKTRATDPTGAAKMAEIFASADIIAVIDQKMQQTYGMRANNVADAYAVWWVSAWMGSKGRSDDATPGQMAMVKRQATNALAATPEFASATDAGKQELAEALLVQAALIGDTIDTYASDPAMLAKARAAIAKGASGMGLDLSKMILTDQGFVPSRKTGAADPAPGAPDAQLASAAPTTNDNNPPYLLMAAAGGAGIGGVFMLGKMMGRRG